MYERRDDPVRSRFVTPDDARAILSALRAGKELRILGMDGEWGLRATANGFVTWDHPAWGESIYGASAQKDDREEEALAILLPHDAASMREKLR